MHSWTSYTGGRLCAVATRPLCLFFANNYLGSDTAQGLAIAFLSSALALVATAADSHRAFYLRRFGVDACPGSMAFYVYVASLIVVGGIGGVGIFVVGVHFTASVPLAAAIVVYFFSEKLADEVLRYRLFERDFDQWGRSSIVRSLLQLSGLAALLGVAGRDVPPWAAVVVLSAGNLLVFLRQLPAGIGRALLPHRFVTLARLSRRAIRALIENWMLWALALITASVGYLDRLFVLFLDKATLPLFMLVVMCFSVVQLVVDFMYVSRHRRDFLEQRIPVERAFTSSGFVRSLTAGVLIGAGACLAVLVFSHNGASFPLPYVCAVAVLQTAFAVTTVPQQILYWRRHIRRLFRIELLFWILLVATVSLGLQLDFPIAGLFGLLVGCALLRLIFYVSAARRTESPVPAEQ